MNPSARKNQEPIQVQVPVQGQKIARKGQENLQSLQDVFSKDVLDYLYKEENCRTINTLSTRLELYVNREK